MDENEWLSYMKVHYFPFCRHYGLYRELYEKIFSMIKKHMPFPAYAADLGCGPGIFINGILKNFPFIKKIYGYEKITGLAGIGVEKLQYLKKGRNKVSFYEGADIAKSMSMPEECDLILNINVMYINGLGNRNQLLQNIKNNLAEDGIAVIATVMNPWNRYKSDGSLVMEEFLYNLILKPWRIPIHLLPLLIHAKPVKKYNDTLASDLTPVKTENLLEKNGFRILEKHAYYTPRKFLTNDLNSAGGVVYLTKKNPTS
jgi:SAM-dependent methyltransferase